MVGVHTSPQGIARAALCQQEGVFGGLGVNCLGAGCLSVARRLAMSTTHEQKSCFVVPFLIPDGLIVVEVSFGLAVVVIIITLVTQARFRWLCI